MTAPTELVHNATVHGIAPGRSVVEARAGDETIRADAESLVVEMTTDDPRHGNLTLNYIGAQREAAKEFFQDKDGAYELVVRKKSATPAAAASGAKAPAHASQR